MPLFDPYQEIEGYAELTERTEFTRNAAFLGLPETICGFEVRPLTARHLLWLEIAQSPFTSPNLLKAEDAHIHVAAFLRIVSPDFDAFGRWRRRFFFWKYRRHFYGQKTDQVQAVKEIHEYVSEALQDAPGDSASGGESYWSLAASLVHSLSGHYGWPIDYVLDVPLKAAFQLLKIQTAEDHAKTGRRKIMFNPADALKSRWLGEQNRKLKEN